jgi:hypothetical protein
MRKFRRIEKIVLAEPAGELVTSDRARRIDGNRRVGYHPGWLIDVGFATGSSNARMSKWQNARSISMDEELTNEFEDDPFESDPLLAPDVWRPIISRNFCDLSDQYPEKYDLKRVQHHNPDIFDSIVAKLHELDRLEVARTSELIKLYRQIVGLFDQSFWLQQGYVMDELALDENGDVRAVLVAFRTGGRYVELLGEFWKTFDEEFRSPDGRPVYQLEEVESLPNKSEADLRQIRLSKLQ